MKVQLDKIGSVTLHAELPREVAEKLSAANDNLVALNELRGALACDDDHEDRKSVV